jgi:hypothetical protein
VLAFKLGLDLFQNRTMFTVKRLLKWSNRARGGGGGGGGVWFFGCGGGGLGF